MFTVKPNETVIQRIRAIRGGRTIEMVVQVKAGCRNDFGWVRKEDGRPLFGTTGYWREDSQAITTYRGAVLLANVEVI